MPTKSYCFVNFRSDEDREVSSHSQCIVTHTGCKYLQQINRNSRHRSIQFISRELKSCWQRDLWPVLWSSLYQERDEWLQSALCDHQEPWCSPHCKYTTCTCHPGWNIFKVLYPMQAVDQFYTRTSHIREDTEMSLGFDRENISLSIPREGVKLESGWRIVPLYDPIVRFLLCILLYQIIIAELMLVTSVIWSSGLLI